MPESSWDSSALSGKNILSRIRGGTYYAEGPGAQDEVLSLDRLKPHADASSLRARVGEVFMRDRESLATLIVVPSASGRFSSVPVF